LLDKAAALNAAQARALSLAWDELWHAEGSPAPAALRRAKQAATQSGRDWEDARRRAWNLADSAPWPSSYQIRRGISDAGHAILAADLISVADYAALRAPWDQVTGQAP
ncbi:MAG: hypothetical protein WA634_15955, partial [Silvibacterium sp.]